MLTTRHFVMHIVSCRISVRQLRLTSEIVGRRYVFFADTTTLQVSSTCQAVLGDRAFSVAATRARNSVPPVTRACSSLSTFRRKTKSHFFRHTYG